MYGRKRKTFGQEAKEFLIGVRSGADNVNPARFDDPIALKTSWDPAFQYGGPTRAARKLVRVGAQRIEFRRTLGDVLVYWAFIGFAVLFMLVSAHAFLFGGTYKGSPIAGFAAGAFFVLVACLFLAMGKVPIVFDKRSGYFWIGKQGPDDPSGKGSRSALAEFRHIHALQLVWKQERSGDESSSKTWEDVYELNLVLKDGRRINTRNEDKVDSLRKEAHELGRFLQVPVWDGTLGR